MSLRDDFEAWAREFTELDLEWMEDEGGYQFLNTDFTFMAYQAATERAVRIVEEEQDADYDDHRNRVKTILRLLS